MRNESDQASDRSLFASLLVRNDRKLIRYIMSFIPRRDDAEEVLQRAATVLWEKFSEYDPQRDFLPWALRFTYFEILNFRKEHSRSRLMFRVDLLELLEQSRPALEPLFNRQRDALRECLAELDAPSQSLLRERYCDCESVSTLAELRGKPVKSMYRRLYKLRQRMAKCVENRLAKTPN